MQHGREQNEDSFKIIVVIHIEVRARESFNETNVFIYFNFLVLCQFYYFLESGIGTDISSGEDHGIRYDQSERGIAFTRQPAINDSNLFSDTISTDVSYLIKAKLNAGV